MGGDRASRTTDAATSTVVPLRRRPSPVVASEVAERIVACRAAGAPLSVITGSLHMTPGEVRSVLRVRAGEAPELAAPIVASRAAGELVMGAIGDAERAAALTGDPVTARRVRSWR